ncbi:MAG: penicillin-binding protein 1A [Arenicella sp.]
MTENNPTTPKAIKQNRFNKSSFCFHLFLWACKFAFIGATIVSFVFLSLQRELPSTASITSTQLKTPLRVFSAEGLLIAEFGDERRKPMDLESAPKQLINAILASEDSNFYSHFGIDLKGILRAIINNYQTGSRQGASTITQQVARNYFLSSEQTYSRKIREIMLALKLESTLSKNDILNLYFNKIFLGHRSYGFAAAADVYYGKTLEQLTIAEQAMLAGLPKAPSRNNPISNPERAKIRRDYVLERLLKNNWITQEQHQTAINSPLTAERQRKKTLINAPYVAEMVRQNVLKTYGNEAYWQGLDVYTNIQKNSQAAANSALRKSLLNYDKRHGFRGPLKSVKDLPKSNWAIELQNIQPSGSIIPAVIDDVKKEVASLLTRDNEKVSITLKNSSWAKKYISSDIVGSTPQNLTKILKVGDIVYIEPDTEEQNTWKLSQLPQAQGALVSTEIKSGKIIALAGGFDFYFNNYNRVTQAKRQPGSSLKPFIYAAALDKGYTPSSKISGAPIVIEDVSQGTVWRPQNYSQKIYPPTPLRVALAKSMNLVSVRLLRAIGVDYGRDYLAKFGFQKDRLAKSLSLALGSGSATPLEVNRAYATIANSGYLITPRIIDRIESRNGTILFKQGQQKFCDNCNESSEKIAPRVMPKTTNFIINDMLKDVVRYGTAKKAQTLNRGDLGGKTGTTNDYVDAWFNGFGGGLVTTSWIGFDTPQTLGYAESGGRTALPMWIDFMKVALADRPEYQLDKPYGMAELKKTPANDFQTNPQNQSERGEYSQPPQTKKPNNVPVIEGLF